MGSARPKKLSRWVFVFLSNHYWGTGHTLTEARNNWRAAGGRPRSCKPLVYMLPKGAKKDSVSVDAMGTLYWEGGPRGAHMTRIDDEKGNEPNGR